MKFSIFLMSVLLVSTSWALTAKHGQVTLDKLEEYDRCQTMDYDGDHCQDALNRWVDAHPGDAFKAAQMTRKKMNAWAALPLFKKAFDKNQGNCKDEDLKLAIVSGMDLPPDNYKDIVATAKELGLKKCVNEMKKPIADAATGGSYAFKNSCKELITLGMIGGLKKKQCEVK
jgi:hypothetical protein